MPQLDTTIEREQTIPVEIYRVKRMLAIEETLNGWLYVFVPYSLEGIVECFSLLWPPDTSILLEVETGDFMIVDNGEFFPLNDPDFTFFQADHALRLVAETLVLTMIKMLLEQSLL